MSDKVVDSSVVKDILVAVSEPKEPESIEVEVPEPVIVINDELDGMLTYLREKRSVSVYELLRKFSKKTIQLALMRHVLVKLNMEEQIIITLGNETDIAKYYDMRRIEADIVMGYNYWS